MRGNLQRMITAATKNNVQLRPHFKTHKSLWIADEQLKAGACGITVAKPSEAETLFHYGVTDILLAFPVVDEQKVFHLMSLSKNKRLVLTVDSFEQAEIISKQASKQNKNQEVWIKVNSGLNRCGVEQGEPVLKLAQIVKQLPQLELTGLYTHAGHAYAAKNEKERQSISLHEAKSIVDSATLCERFGITLKHRSIGSTPTFEIGATIKGITEIRPGNAIFFDGVQASLGVATKDEVALTVLATVVSIKEDRIILDTGSKALTTEKGAHGNESIKGYGQVVGKGRDIEITRLSEEHGIIDLKNDHDPVANELKIGEKVEIIPNHACTAVNLFDRYYVVNESGDVMLRSIEGRGKSQ